MPRPVGPTLPSRRRHGRGRRPAHAAAAIHAWPTKWPAARSRPRNGTRSIYLVVHDLAQFRDLRQSEDDFSFSFGKATASRPRPTAGSATSSRKAPRVGVHMLLWCESYNSLTRSIDRLTLREIEFRIATQMSGADSTSLIDSPAACACWASIGRSSTATTSARKQNSAPTAAADGWLAWLETELPAASGSTRLCRVAPQGRANVARVLDPCETSLSNTRTAQGAMLRTSSAVLPQVGCSIVARRTLFHRSWLISTKKSAEFSSDASHCAALVYVAAIAHLAPGQ